MISREKRKGREFSKHHFSLKLNKKFALFACFAAKKRVWGVPCAPKRAANSEIDGAHGAP
jgi:hypothetical protein